MSAPLPTLQAAAEADLAALRSQLGRVPRGVVGIAARGADGAPLVVATAPVLPGGEPFPTTFYLTHPQLVRLVSTLEAEHAMDYYRRRLGAAPDFASAYAHAHDLYLRQRAAVARLAGVDVPAPIADVSAGGLPGRVKCLHALVAHALASGPGVNPVGDDVLRRLWAAARWRQPGWREQTSDGEV